MTAFVAERLFVHPLGFCGGYVVPLHSPASEFSMKGEWIGEDERDKKAKGTEISSGKELRIDPRGGMDAGKRFRRKKMAELSNLGDVKRLKVQDK